MMIFSSSVAVSQRISWDHLSWETTKVGALGEPPWAASRAHGAPGIAAPGCEEAAMVNLEDFFSGEVYLSIHEVMITIH